MPRMKVVGLWRQGHEGVEIYSGDEFVCEEELARKLESEGKVKILGPEKEEKKGLSEMNIEEITKYIQTIEDVFKLEELLKVEKQSDQPRKGALSAIKARIDALSPPPEGQPEEPEKG